MIGAGGNLQPDFGRLSVRPHLPPARVPAASLRRAEADASLPASFPSTVQNMFNRWIKGKQDEVKDMDRRPYLATECKDLNACDKWRQEILREIGKKVMEIQNAGLGEHRLRGGARTSPPLPRQLPAVLCCPWNPT